MNENSVADKKTPVMTWIGLAVLFAVAALVYIYSRTLSYNNGTYIDIYGDIADRTIATGTVDLQDIGTIETTFSIDYDMIRGVALQITYDSEITPEGNVHIDMYDEGTGEQVVSADFDAFKFSRFVYSPFAFDTLLPNSGNTYRVVMSFSGFENQGVSLLMLDDNPFLGVITAGKDNFLSMQNLTYIVMLVLLVLSIVFMYVSRFKSFVRIEHVYAIVGLGFGMLYALWIPVGVAPDEPSHMHTAYYVSDRMMGISYAADGTSIMMREDDFNLELQTTNLDRGYINQYYDDFFSKADNAEVVETEHGILDTQLYLYILPGFGITVGRLLGLGSKLTLYIGRLFNIFFFVWAVYFSIKKTPFAKSVFFVWALIPMILQQTSSYSYDSPILALCAIVTAMTLRFLYDERKAKKSELIIYVAALVLLLPCKGFTLFPLVAFSLVFAVKLIRAKKDKIKAFWDKNKSWLKKVLIIGGVVIVVAFAAAAVIAYRYVTAPERINNNYISWADHTGYTVGYFIKNPNKLVCVLLETLIHSGESYFMQMLGSYLGWLEMGVSALFLAVYMVLLIFASIRKENEDVYITKGVRVYMWVISIIVCGLAAAAMLLRWTPNTNGYISGLQGRYFLPVLPLALIACRSSHTSTKADNDKIIVVIAVFMQVFILTSLCRNYG